MSTALVSSGGFRDYFIKQEPKTALLKSILVDTSNRKVVGAQLGFNMRRNSGSTVTLSMNMTNKNNTSSICLSDANIICNNHLQQQQQQQQMTPSHRKLDRSMSEPVERRSSNSGNNLATQDQQQQQRAGNQGGNSSRYKTELCRPYEENGTCKYGDKCQFAHGGHELRTLARHPKYKTELCRTFHTTGFCPYGPRCHFIHNEEESRKNGNGSPPPPMAGRPKALSIGGYSSLDSPPSSLSESPTSTGSFFSANDDPFVSNQVHQALASLSSNSSPPTPTTITGNNSFKYPQDFVTAFNNYTNRLLHQQYAIQKLNSQQGNLNDLTDNVFRVASPPLPIICSAVMEAPSSPDSSSTSSLSSSSSSSSSDDDSLSPTGSPTCTSPLDVSKNLRLPIFSQLSISDD